MINPVIFGQYLAGRSFLHRLTPPVKVMSLLFLLAALFAVNSFWGLGMFALLAVGLYRWTGLPIRYLVTGLKPILYIILFTLVVYAFSTKGGIVLLRVGRFTIESFGVNGGLFIVSRLILLLWFTMLLTFTTAPLALTAGLEHLLKPLQWFRLPVAEVAMIMTIALRFIPTLGEEGRRIMKAQVARGANIDTAGFRQKITNLAPLIIPLFVSAFRRADELASAMEARGYRVGEERTSLKKMTAGLTDWFTLTGTLAILVGTLISRI